MTENTTPPVTNTIKGTRKAPTKKPKASPKKKTFKIKIAPTEFDFNDAKELRAIVTRLTGVIEKQVEELKHLHKEVIEQDVRIDALQKRIDRFAAITEEDIKFLKDELRHVHLEQLDNDIHNAEKSVRDAEHLLAKAIAESNGDDAALAIRKRDDAMEQLRKKTHQKRLAEAIHREDEGIEVAPLSKVQHA